MITVSQRSISRGTPTLWPTYSVLQAPTKEKLTHLPMTAPPTPYSPSAFTNIYPTRYWKVSQSLHFPKRFILGCGCIANARIISDGRQESSNKSEDQSWRRWIGFFPEAGLAPDPFLSALSQHEIDIVAKAFVSCFRTAAWTEDGEYTGTRKRPMSNQAPFTSRTAKSCDLASPPS
jgi:hypothetical protein